MPKILLAHALSWSNIAHLAIAFHDVGCEVYTLAVREHPVQSCPFLTARLVYNPLDPGGSLRRAIEVVAPDLIVPCDDRIVEHMRRAYTAGAQSGRSLIEASLGPYVARGDAASRMVLRDVATLSGVRTPPMASIDSARDLRAFIASVGVPLFLKLDGTWGGRGAVPLTSSSRSWLALLNIRARGGWIGRLKRLMVNRDIEVLRELKRRISAQALVAGREANIAIACWRGKVIASVAVEALQTAFRFGVSSVVRVREDDEMLDMARVVSDRLQLSGLHGLDFIIDEEGRPHLIEVNTRATPTAHLPLGADHDLIAALRAAMTGETTIATRPLVAERNIALFPQEWRRNPVSPWLSSAYHDVPRSVPELVRAFGYPADSVEVTNLVERPEGWNVPRLRRSQKNF